ncbi:hypothetical protein R3P38DRAFT_2891986 [Favolaschia claudopus]|uniref:Uncharacterized protein n=1 Tax=Favolaschia claudopus TaxID=2862362 RepID=A0AAW0CSK5_9AGAR
MDVTVSLDVAFGPVPIADFEFDCLRNSDAPCDGMVTGMQCPYVAGSLSSADSAASQHAKEMAAEVGLGVAVPQGQADPPLCLEIAEPKGKVDSAESLEIAAPRGNADSAIQCLDVASKADSAACSSLEVAGTQCFADSAARNGAESSLICLADSMQPVMHLILRMEGENYLTSESQAEAANGNDSVDDCCARDLLAGVDTGLSQPEGVHDVLITKSKLADISVEQLHTGKTNTYVLPEVNSGLSFEIETGAIRDPSWRMVPRNNGAAGFVVRGQ